MCGIAGFCDMPKDAEKQIKKMTDAIIRRGPDSGNYWISEDKKVVLGHRRLAILDLSPSGNQPMLSHSERFVIAFNGEIYNYKELEQELRKTNPLIKFRGTSDTEVLLESIEQWGIEKTAQKCNGMFALAVYDKKMGRLSLAKDRAGEKPLYYGFIKDKFVFASDLKCMERVEGFEREINTELLHHYLVCGVIPAPFSIYQGIFQLLPGEILECEYPHREIRTYKYWDIREIADKGQKNPYHGTFGEAAEELNKMIVNAVQRQMRSDVPTGSFLSAGVDSTTITAVMQSLSKKPVKTFTIGFKDKTDDEAIAAGRIAQYLGTDHTELYVDEKTVKEVIPIIPDIYSEPFADSSQIPTYLVSKLAKEKATVILSGDAGDELFCGYSAYPAVEKSWNKINRLPRVLREMGAAGLTLADGFGNRSCQIHGRMLKADSPGHLRVLSAEGDSIIQKLLIEDKGPRLKYCNVPGLDLKHNLMLQDFSDYLGNDILVKVDRASMYVSLETRVPLLDKDIIEFAWSLPGSYKYENGLGKRVLREVLYRYVPRDMMERPKTGFSIPISKWICEEPLRSWAEELLRPGKIREQQIFNEKIVLKMWRDYIDKKIWRKQIWYILLFQQWYLNQ